jgi:hypothetical protein
MTDTGFPEAGDRVECVIPRMDEHSSPKKFRFEGIVARTEPPEDGWGAGIVVDYPKLKHKGVMGVLCFHEWPNRFIRVTEAAS